MTWPSNNLGDQSGLTTPWLHSLMASMPKAELHLHLDGALQIDTALALARSRDVDAPKTYSGMFAALVAPSRPGSQAQLLESFELPVQLLQDQESLERVTYELVIAKAADHVGYMEIRWAPTLHTRKGLSVSEVIDAVCNGARAGEQATGAIVRLILVGVRSHDPKKNVSVAEIGGKYRGQGVVGFDLAGLEAEFPDPRLHAKAFTAAREAGLHITLHGGEISGHSPFLWDAMEFSPERIAHGVCAAENASLINELIRRDITLDLCPTSNIQAGSANSFEEYPLTNLFHSGVGVTISTDDPILSNITLSQEYFNAVHSMGLTLPELWKINQHALRAAFVEQDTLEPLYKLFSRWAEPIPELFSTSSGCSEILQTES